MCLSNRRDQDFKSILARYLAVMRMVVGTVRYQITSRRSGPVEKLPDVQLLKKFPTFYIT
jgi:hypothetical protein